MAYISTTYTFSNGAVADASQVNQNYTDIISGLSDGTKDLNMNAATFAGNLTANGNIVLGNASSDTLAFTGAITLGANSTLTAAVGAFATPSINFTSSTTTGLSCAAADTLIVSTAATARLTISSAGLITVGTGGVIANVLGSVTVPSYSFTGDLNTGMWSPGADSISFSVGGAHALTINGTGTGIFVAPNAGYAAEYKFQVGDEGTAGTSYGIMIRSGATATGKLSFSRGANSDGEGRIWYDQTNNKMVFYTNTSSNVTIDSSGNLGVGVTPSARNNTRLQIVDGIGFPATQVASSDANTLDDYEENTWTPTLGGNTTYTKQLGNYTKIGRHVYFSCIVHVNAIGTGSATTVSGLPFAAAAGDVTYAINVGYWTGTVNSYVYLAGEINAGASNFVFYGATTAATALSVPVNVFQNSTLVRVSGHYIV